MYFNFVTERMNPELPGKIISQERLQDNLLRLLEDPQNTSVNSVTTSSVEGTGYYGNSNSGIMSSVQNTQTIETSAATVTFSACTVDDDDDDNSTSETDYSSVGGSSEHVETQCDTENVASLTGAAGSSEVTEIASGIMNASHLAEERVNLSDNLTNSFLDVTENGEFYQVQVFKVAFLQNTTIEYSLESLCVSVCVCFCVCVFLHDKSKRNSSRNLKFKCMFIVV